MALDSTPWLVGGGAEHSAEVARLLAYAGTAGAEGIVSAGSLLVRAQATPAASVRVAPGAALILNKYAGGGQQTYVLRNASQTTVPIRATGSTGQRTDMVVARILDPQYEGQAPSDPNAFNYSRLEVIESVPPGVWSVDELGLTYPAVALAKIHLPNNTATVTSDMIVDLREVANPRTNEVWRPRALAGGDSEDLYSRWSNGGQIFPSAGIQVVRIPKWATRAQIEMQWLSVRYAANKPNLGRVWVEFGPASTGSRFQQYTTDSFHFNAPDSGDISRANWIVADDVYIPVALRGTEQTFVPVAGIDDGYATDGVSLDGISGVNLKIRFLEQADPSTL